MPYLFDEATRAERERLAAIEAGLDPFSIECLQKIGVSAGWCCLEIGAGGGSMTEWFCRHVGPTGRVVATDVQTKFLQAIESSNLEVRQLDITTHEIDTEAFDLVFARKVLEHLANPTVALQRMFNSVRPGGWTVVEDSDLASFRHVSAPHPERFERAYSAFLAAMQAAGFHANFGIRLGDELRALGAESVEVNGRTTEWSASGDHPTGKLYRMTFERLRERVAKAGLLTDDEVQQFFVDIQAPEFHAMTGIHFAARGKRPA
jgi:SAM-dependent methyltransferase